MTGIWRIGGEGINLEVGVCWAYDPGQDGDWVSIEGGSGSCCGCS